MKYIISWDVGNGPEFKIAYVVDWIDAMDAARYEWEKANQHIAEYNAQEWSEELAEEYGL